MSPSRFQGRFSCQIIKSSRSAVESMPNYFIKSQRVKPKQIKISLRPKRASASSKQCTGEIMSMFNCWKSNAVDATSCQAQAQALRECIGNTVCFKLSSWLMTIVRCRGSKLIILLSITISIDWSTRIDETFS